MEARYSTGWAASRASKNLKQIKGKLKLKINFDWNQPNLKVIVTDTFKEKKGCFILLFLDCFHYTTRKSLVHDLRPTLYVFSENTARSTQNLYSCHELNAPGLNQKKNVKFEFVWNFCMLP